MSKPISILWATCLSLACSIAFVAEGAAFSAPLTADEADEIAVEAYIYAYPLVFMDLTRELVTNVARPHPYGYSPVNQFGHKRAFPDAAFYHVPRPNADTLYSALFFDVKKEPLIIDIPDSGGRYYLLQMVDLWTDTFASLGKRTTGTGPQTYMLAGPDWEGAVPENIEMIRCPTNTGMIAGRTQTNGKKDYENVHAFMDGFVSMPLSAWGTDFTWPEAKTNPDLQKGRPVQKVAKMDAATFFARFSELVKDNSPHGNDYPLLARMRRIGLEPGKPFRLADQPAIVQNALNKAPQVATPIIVDAYPKVGKIINNWQIRSGLVGTFGAAYLRRATNTWGGVISNVVEDAVYPKAYTDAKGEPLTSDRKYVLRFEKDDLPPVRAFWSLSMYNEKNFFADNPLNRYAIGDRDKLEFDEDGSLTIYMQRASPGEDKESNWLPTPKEGAFSVSLRLYWPKPEVLRDPWSPPAVERVERTSVSGGV
jgi:hypothetical protein